MRSILIMLIYPLCMVLFICAANCMICKNLGGVLSVADNSDVNVSLSGQGTISIDRSRTKSDIVEMAKQTVHSGFTYGKTTQYENSPVLTMSYNAGTLLAEDIEDALNAIKMIRYIAGLPYENIRFNDQLNSAAQHGSVLIAASGQFSHSPAKPEDMSDDFYALASKGCSSSNLYKGSTNASTAILGFMTDPGSGNIGYAAHRRWILRPSSVDFGIGYAEKITSLYVVDSFHSGGEQADTYIAWPNCGDFPIEYFVGSGDISTAPEYPWSVNLGAAYSTPIKEDITIILTRLRDNKVWSFDKNTPQLGEGNMADNSTHLAVDDIGYGIGKAIIFRPDVVSLGAILDGDEFTVEISGLKDSSGSDTKLNYTIRFFSLNAEIEKVNQVYNYTKGELAKDIHVSGKVTDAVPYYVENAELFLVNLSAVIDKKMRFIAPATAEYHIKYNHKSYSDIYGHWGEEDIEFVAARELFLGTGGFSFSPDGTMTRAMLVTVLARMYRADSGKYAGKAVFSDVDVDAWYASSVAWAYESGIVKGIDNSTFSPYEPVSREQMATILVRYSEFCGHELKNVNTMSIFSDNAEISPWSADAVYTLQAAGIVGGKPGNVFDPHGHSTRAQISAVLRRYIEAILS